MRLYLVFSLFLFALSSSLFGAAYTVTNGNDSGAGSFRQALLDLDSSGGASNTISFSASFSISLLSSLPQINKNVVITGNNSTVNSNSLTSTFTIDAVTVEIQSLTLEGNSGSSGAVTLTGDGTLKSSGSTFSSTRALTLGGAGGAVEVDSGTTTISGTVSGTELNKTGAGTLLLSGSGASTTALNLNVGTLQTSTNVSFGSIANTATFVLDQTASGTFSANMSGAGEFHKSNSGAVTLASNILGFTGPIKILNGSLSISSSSKLGSGDGVLTLGDGANTGTLIVTGDATLPNAVVLAGAGGVVTTSGSITATLSGTMSGVGIPLTKGGAGTLVLTGSNTNSGPISILGGTLKGDTDSIVGSSLSIASTAGVEFNQAGTGTYSVAISGDGEVIKSAGGTLTLSGANSYTGGTTVTGGTLKVSSDGNLGDASGGLTLSGGGTLQTTSGFSTSRNLTLGTGGGTVQVDAGTLAFTGVVNATTLTKEGAGTLELTDSTGTIDTVNLNTGTFKVQPGPTISTAISLETGTFLTVNSGATQTLPAHLSGAGELLKEGAGTLILTHSSNTDHTGFISIIKGTLSVGSASNLGVGKVFLGVAGGFPSTGTLRVTGAGSTTFSNSEVELRGPGGIISTDSGVYMTLSSDITGSKPFTKSGAGTLSTTGDVAVSTATVSGGRLAVNKTLTASSSTVTVDAGAEIGGSGTITGDVSCSGTCLPGNSVGTLSVVGSFDFEVGADYKVDVAPTEADKLVVSGAPGTVEIKGSNNLILFTDTSVMHPKTNTYVLISATGGVTGEFAQVINELPLFSGTVEYTGTEVILTHYRSDFLDVIQGGNPGRVSQYLDTLWEPPAGTDLHYVFTQLQALNTTELRAALNQLHPANSKGLVLTQENNSIRVRSMMTQKIDELYKTCCNREQGRCNRLNFWAGTYGDTFRLSSEFELSGVRAHTGAGLVGADYAVMRNFSVGGVASYTKSEVHWAQSVARGKVESFYGGVYSSFHHKHAYVNAALIGAYNSYKVKRKIRFGGLHRKARTVHEGAQSIAHLSGGILLPIKCVEFRPFISLDDVYMREKAYKERGADSINLKVQGSSNRLLRTEWGLNLAACLRACTSKWIPEVKAGWIHERHSLGRFYSAHFVNTAGSFIVKGILPHTLRFSPAAGITGIFADDRCSLSLRYEGEFGKKYKDHSGRFQFIYSF